MEGSLISRSQKMFASTIAQSVSFTQYFECPHGMSIMALFVYVCVYMCMASLDGELFSHSVTINKSMQ